MSQTSQKTLDSKRSLLIGHRHIHLIKGSERIHSLAKKQDGPNRFHGVLKSGKELRHTHKSGIITREKEETTHTDITPPQSHSSSKQPGLILGKLVLRCCGP